MAGIGDLMGPAQPGQEQEASSWSDLVKDPVARSALLGFGLQMMTGGWGNGAQQLAAGIGAGASSAASTSEALQKQLEAEDKAASAEANQSANRANAIKVAQIGADSRAEVANLRGEFSLERARMGLQGKASANDIIKYRAEARKSVEGNPSNMALPQAQRDAMIDELATRLYDADSARGLTNKSVTPGASSPNSPAAPGAAAPGQSPAPGAAQAPAAQMPTYQQMAADPKFGPQFVQDMATPDGRAKLKALGGKAATAVNEWETANKPKAEAPKPGWIERYTAPWTGK